MGASGWSYYVPYDADFAAALGKLHDDVFERGEYYRRSKLRKPKSIAHLRELNREEGTHSILDITRIGDRPSAPETHAGRLPPPDPEGQQRWFARWRERMGS
ncbi:MAG TPA: hypothetical protein VMZ53_34620, partial [Kofleriaceae bacterium]|nr:hypothetical protein [Kofleriaceae bacterium]